MHTRKAGIQDAAAISSFYESLNTSTKLLYAPHSMHKDAIIQLVEDPAYLLLISEEAENISGYQVFLKGTFPWERDRYQHYGITLLPSDASYAPVLSDSRQGLGLGKALLHQALPYLTEEGIQRLILWGGVQCSNVRAVNFYLSNGFRIKGFFEWEGANYDMINTIHASRNHPASL
jgi:ribosomal protein S18 acetylase RimI-like enzyme